MSPSRFTGWIILAVAIPWRIHASDPARTNLSALTWSKGPAGIDLQCGAALSLPDGFLFLDGPGTRKLLEEFGNKTSGQEIGFLTPTSRTWFVIVEYLDLGHLKEDNWRALDSSALLRRLRKSDERGNAEREQNGWPTVTVQDWEVPPQYDTDTHSMEWAVRAESGGKSVVNHTISLLGRKGAMQFSLIDPEQRTSSLTAFRRLVRGSSFMSGHRYVDYQPEDPIARAGLAALVGEAAEADTEGGPAVGSTSGANLQRAASFWESPWLAAILAAAITGFVCGRFARGRNQYHRLRPGLSRRLRPSSRRRTTPTTSATPADPGETQGEMPSPAGTDDGRIKRYDSYSFYRALTRDLHWTINY